MVSPNVERRRQIAKSVPVWRLPLDPEAKFTVRLGHHKLLVGEGGTVVAIDDDDSNPKRRLHEVMEDIQGQVGRFHSSRSSPELGRHQEPDATTRRSISSPSASSTSTSTPPQSPRTQTQTMESESKKGTAHVCLACGEEETSISLSLGTEEGWKDPLDVEEPEATTTTTTRRDTNLVGHESGYSVLVAYGAIIGLGSSELKPLFRTRQRSANTPSSASTASPSSAPAASPTPLSLSPSPSISLVSTTLSVDDSAPSARRDRDRVVMGTNRSYVSPCQFEAEILLSAPARQHNDFHFPNSLATFAFPYGITIQSSPSSKSEVRSFVLTEANGNKTYCHCLIRNERVSEKQVEALRIREVLAGTPAQYWEEFYAPRCLCIISRWPFHQRLTLFLQSCDRLTAKRKIGAWLLVRILSLLNKRIDPNNPVSVQLPTDSNSVLEFSLKSLSRPKFDVDHGPLFRSLSANNAITAMTTLLNGGSIIFVSAHLHIITPVIESLFSLMYPMTWPFVYIPLLPATLTLIFESPVPYCVGAHPDFLEMAPPPSDIVIVWLDKDEVTCDTGSPLEVLPSKYVAKLLNVFQKYCKTNSEELIARQAKKESRTSDPVTPLVPQSSKESIFGKRSYSVISSIINALDTSHSANTQAPTTGASKERQLLTRKGDALGNLLALDRTTRRLEISEEGNEELQLAMLNTVFVPLFKMYKYYVKPGDDSCFDKESFVNSVGKEEHKTFLRAFVRTQMFQFFVQDRLVSKEKDLFDKLCSDTLKFKLASYQNAGNNDAVTLMFKKGHVVKSWKKRWFAIVEDELQYAEKTEKQHLELVRGKIPLVAGVTEVTAKKAKKGDPTPWKYRVRTEMKKLTICAMSEEERNIWMKILKSKLKIGKLMATLKTNITLTNTQLANIRGSRERESKRCASYGSEALISSTESPSAKATTPRLQKQKKILSAKNLFVMLWEDNVNSRVVEEDVLDLEWQFLEQDSIDKWFGAQ